MMKKRLLAPMAVCLLGGAVLVVLGYNLWSYCCGRCTAATFLTLGPFGLSLLGLNLLAAGILVALKLRHRRRFARQRCSCGSLSHPSWSFCPDCGRTAAHPS